MKDLLRSVIPKTIAEWRQKRFFKKQSERFSAKTVEETFDEIYRKNLWGGKPGEFYSGFGSKEEYAAIYAENIRRFIEQHDVKTVVDLGCGDFRVASKFVDENIRYIGVDIVPQLVEHLEQNFARRNVEFRCLNIIEDRLPDGDLCLIRQVLQHLSNAEIERVLQNCRHFKNLIVTEEYPDETRELTPNIDVPHSPNTRVYYSSAVCLDAPPFNLQKVQTLFEVNSEANTLFRSFVVRQSGD